jgi:hypothetical protein
MKIPHNNQSDLRIVGKILSNDHSNVRIRCKVIGKSAGFSGAVAGMFFANSQAANHCFQRIHLRV